MAEFWTVIRGVAALFGVLVVVLSLILSARAMAKAKSLETAQQSAKEWESVAKARMAQIEDLQRTHQSQLEQLHHENSELKDLNMQLQKENSTLRNLNFELQLQVNALRSRVQQLEAGKL